MISRHPFFADRAAGHAQHVGFNSRGWLHPDARARHFGGSPPKAPEQVTAAPMKTDAEVQAEAATARLEAQRRRGRRATILTSGGETPGATSAGSLSSPGSTRTIG